MSDRQDRRLFHFEALSKEHDRGSFCSGNGALDSYLRTQARQDQKKSAAVTFVMTNDEITIAGFYTLSQHSVALRDFPPEITKKLPNYPSVPATLIGRLAVDKGFQGMGLGELLLMDALNRCLAASVQVASAAVVVDPKPDREGFYEKYGFIELPGHKGRMFLPMQTVYRLVSE